MLPFTRDAFFAVFAAYNTAVWPAQLFLYGLAVALMVLALEDRPRAHPAASIGLGLLWIWTGVLYHWWHFTAINRAAWGFGALFVVQGGLFVANGIGGRRLELNRPHGWHGWIGGLLLGYSLVVYPLWGLAAGPKAGALRVTKTMVPHPEGTGPSHQPSTEPRQVPLQVAHPRARVYTSFAIATESSP